MNARLLALAIGLVFAGTVSAFHCPVEMKAIDEALAKNPKLSEAQLADVKKYRTEGEKLHNDGKHQEALDTLAKAQKILNLKAGGSTGY